MRLVARRTALAVTAVAVLSPGLLPEHASAQPRAERVRLPIPRYDGTLTPYTFELGYPLVTLVYDTLMWRDREGVPRPWLARGVKRARGGRSLSIRLRKGVFWQDGRRLTGADVAFTFEFAARRFHPRFTPQVSDVKRVVVRSPHRIRIDLRRPSLGFLYQPMADLPILPRHRWQDLPVDRAAPAGRPVGSGPYRLAGARPRSGYWFRANRRYFKGRPRVDQIRVPIIGRPDRAYTALSRRMVDMLPVSLPADPARRLGGAFGIDLERGPSYSGTALVFNLRRPPFNRPAARRAVAAALDPDRVARNVGQAVPADRGYLHPDSTWAPRAFPERFDPAAARRVLARVPSIRVLAPDNDPVRLEAARQVVLALERAGGRAELTRLTQERLGRATGEDGSPPTFEAAILGTPPLASYDPDFLTAVFGARAREASLNYSGYRSRSFEARAHRVATARTQAARRRAVEAELRLLARDAPAVPLFFPQGVFAQRPSVYDGWVFIKGVGILDKRSFLPGEEVRAPATPAPARRGAAPDDEESDSLFEGVRIGLLAVLVVLLGLAAAALLSRRRASRR